MVVTTMYITSSLPICAAWMNSFRCARRKPMNLSIPASAASGIIFTIPGMRATDIRRNSPWKKLDQRVLAPFMLLAELRTTSAINGRPTINEDSVLAAPHCGLF
jgi:hypothetical protein